MKYDCIIVGAGAAGLMCAIETGKRGRSVLLVDHAKKVGEKIRISGGGRCNFTNIHTSPANYLSENPHFCKSALNRYTPQDFIELVEKHRINYHEKTLGQLFCDQSSQQIIDMLLAECENASVVIKTQTTVTSIKKDDAVYHLSFSNHEEVHCESLVIATGGPSIPKMGATGWGYDVAKQFGLKIVTPRAALVPFTLSGAPQEELKPLSGVSFNSIASTGNTTFEEATLITHRGLSGPAILQISSYWKEGQPISINLSPSTNVLETLKAEKKSSGKQAIQTVLSRIIPKRMAQYLCDKNGFKGNLADQSNTTLEAISKATTEWSLTPSGTEGYRTAEVTLGGVDTNELSSKTFESKQSSGLYFIGEVVDVTGHLGGFNFQWAWASGFAAGQYT